ncbi:ricin-type beta-trefoil lectin protein [Actinoplanes teichomyceticus]|uniref:Ricin-type beta-trefoil lectin protein n=1 Tax=Actinoplanes teichomyceticus TaxID=1867 RepID=A0A561WLT2_ACTTI|nr:ricin-type beta-trefoil lectin protein [Actinoplanes teichomyceticus]
MDGEDSGADRDPLLVRPFVVQDDVADAAATSDATWPAGPAPDSPTQVLPVFSGGTGNGPETPRRKRRPLLLTGAGAAAATALALVGYTALRPGSDTALSSGLPDHPLPAVTGPAAVSASPTPGAADGSTGGGDRGAGSGPAAAGSTAASSSATTSSAPATSPTSARATASASTSAVAPDEPDTPAGLVPSPLLTGTGALVSGNGLCLDLPGAIPVDDSTIQVFDCNRSVAQVWTLADDGTLRVMGKCALLVGDSTVHLTGCDGRTTAKWRATGSGELVNAAGNGCLTDPSSGARPGTRVVVVACRSQPNQRWSLR